jgi:hypothetical protein
MVTVVTAADLATALGVVRAEADPGASAAPPAARHARSATAEATVSDVDRRRAPGVQELGMEILPLGMRLELSRRAWRTNVELALATAEDLAAEPHRPRVSVSRPMRPSRWRA